MKITCNSLLEAPVINLIKLYDSLNVKGICGILTQGSKHNVEHTTIGALGLLSYCNELTVSDSIKDRLTLVDIVIEKGPITYSKVAESSDGFLEVPSNLSSAPFAMSTGTVRFKLLIGVTSANSTLREEDVYTFVAKNNSKDDEFTGVPLPLRSKKLLQFGVNSSNGVSTIQCSGVTESIVGEMFSAIKVE